MLELFGANTGNSYRAAIALHEAELPFEARLVDLRSGEQRSEGFRRLNPAGKVPVMVDHRDPAAPFVLTQSNAIILHAAAVGAPSRLLPDDAAARVRALERFFYFVTDAIAWSGAAFTLGGRDQKVAADLLESTLVQRLEAAERFLTDGPFMAGADFSIADVAGFTIVRAYKNALDWRPERPLVQWFERVDARPAVQRGLGAFRKS
jgi:GSH-dependent disulfide-bond oxidoreductase